MAQWLRAYKNLLRKELLAVEPLRLSAVKPFSGCKNINKNEI
jgi:hypothetical protein